MNYSKINTKNKSLTDQQRQELIDKYDVDDIIAILEPDIEDLIDILEEWIVDNLEDFELQNDYSDNDND